MICLRCNGTRKERKRPNLPALPCYWCEGTGVEPDTEDRIKCPVCGIPTVPDHEDLRYEEMLCDTHYQEEELKEERL